MGYTIDTAATIRSLEAAGIQPEQASAIVNAIIQSDEALATKADATALKADLNALKADVKTLEGDLRAELTALEARITMRLYTCSVGIVGLLLAAQLFASDFLG